MTYVVTDTCIRCKFTDCVEVCPQQAFREGRNMVVIDPRACTNCALCEVVCPIEAIKADYALAVDEKHLADLNARYAAAWPVAEKKAPPSDAHDWASTPSKLHLLDPKPMA